MGLVEGLYADDMGQNPETYSPFQSFFFFFFFAMLRGLRDLSSQGLNPGHGSESAKS